MKPSLNTNSTNSSSRQHRKEGRDPELPSVVTSSDSLEGNGDGLHSRPIERSPSSSSSANVDELPVCPRCGNSVNENKRDYKGRMKGCAC